ncbi:aldo/keto reductase [Nonomuraea zeae]|uniref:NADP-dependent oxidoreductase domain-containing protein n=1 Tax=Nonomuraea zeae TaxID=1642303 RepID=A0A5S4FVX6_9ACTN|nr:aldo/keto reductase [Nonomuraea zeae]TMR14883.1 hypothetical protein ETD85_56470 [Nonomuraea zeae]
MEQRTLGVVGLGGAGTSGAYGRSTDEQTIATLRNALGAGITADHDGMGHDETLVGQVLRPADRDRAVVSVKFGALSGVDGSVRGSNSGIDNRPDAIPDFLGYSLRRLGTGYAASRGATVAQLAIAWVPAQRRVHREPVAGERCAPALLSLPDSERTGGSR